MARQHSREVGRVVECVHLEQQFQHSDADIRESHVVRDETRKMGYDGVGGMGWPGRIPYGVTAF